MKFRSLSLAAAALTAALALPAALPAYAADGPAAAQTAPAAQDDANHQGLNARINAKDGVGLVFEGSDWHADHVTPPSNIPNGGGTNFILMQDNSHWSTEYGAYGTAKARIWDHGKPTDFWIKMYASVYYYPYTKASCTIFRGDPDVTGKQIDFSPYSCDVTSIDHSDPWRVVFNVGHTAAETITDKDTQARLLNDACKGENAEQNCFYTPKSVEFITDSPKPYGAPVANPYDSKMTMGVKSEHVVGTSNTVGVEFSTTLTLWKIWENSLKVSYQHTWTDSRSFSQSVDVDVPPHTEYWFTIAASLDRVTGDFLVRANGKVFRIENATVVLPDKEKSATIVGNRAHYAGTTQIGEAVK
ncbi:hypothetical protein SCMU_02280 [Sinomonas cyclohexanicum]|uniref:Uncharacterized protein n=1 Tax=Sinomonas cyclohexanicum TaxID=322009 RepID=A0ABM7PQQ4_SINCY|nr:hypothetical protein [Corynebacterium cyclohexanicum]BCT74386.1 hypothetical protein SCMU_02280 [Corynebacterium cyclohexanicum]